jgi:toxin-antitoxin system PIN domain toxin
MNLIDANLLLYAYNSATEQHHAARRWIEGVFSSAEPAGLTWVTILAFLRLATNPRVFARPLSERDAVTIVDQWLRVPAVRVFDPGPRHWTILSGLILTGQVRGPLMTDAYLAAIAIEHGLVLCTNDKDFTRFDGLRVFNPLIGGPAN